MMFQLSRNTPLLESSKGSLFTYPEGEANHRLQWFQKAFKEEEHVITYVRGETFEQELWADLVRLITKIMKK